MGCASSRNHLPRGKRSNKRWIAPESNFTNPPKHLPSSFVHRHGSSEPNSQHGSSESSPKAMFAIKESPLPDLEPLEKDPENTTTSSMKISDETTSQQIPEEEAATPKIGAFYGHKKLERVSSNAPEIIDIYQLMEGLEDAECLASSSFRIPRTNKHQIHTRSSSLSDIPSPRPAGVAQPYDDPETRRKRESFAQFQQQYASLESCPSGDSLVPRHDVTRLSRIQDTVTVIKEVIESHNSFKPQRSRTKRDEHEFSKKSVMTDDSSQSTTSLGSSLGSDLKSSYEFFSSDEFLFAAGCPLKKDVRNSSPDHEMGLVVPSKETKEREVHAEDRSIDGSSTLFAGIPLQSLKYVNLGDFKKRVPPRGENRVVLYATRSSEVRETYEDCNLVRQILCSYNLDLDERDVYLHPEFNEELQKVLQKNGSVSLPRLFIKGRHIGSVEEVCLLHKAKALERLLQVFSAEYIKALCVCCGGTRTLQCLSCNGMSLIKTEQGDIVSCAECEKKGWTMCPICS